MNHAGLVAAVRGSNACPRVVTGGGYPSSLLSHDRVRCHRLSAGTHGDMAAFIEQLKDKWFRILVMTCVALGQNLALLYLGMVNVNGVI